MGRAREARRPMRRRVRACEAGRLERTSAGPRPVPWSVAPDPEGRQSRHLRHGQWSATSHEWREELQLPLPDGPSHQFREHAGRPDDRGLRPRGLTGRARDGRGYGAEPITDRNAGCTVAIEEAGCTVAIEDAGCIVASKETKSARSGTTVLSPDPPFMMSFPAPPSR